MKKTRKERGWLKKTFKRAMDKELREHKSSFIVFYILRALVIVSLVRQIILDNYEGAFFCILTIVLLYVPSAAGTRLIAQTEKIVLSAARHPAEATLRRLFAFAGNDSAQSLSPDVTLQLSTVNPVEISGDTATVNLAASALSLSHSDLYVACQAIANTLTQWGDIRYVNVLVSSIQPGLDVGASVPAGCFAANAADTIDAMLTAAQTQSAAPADRRISLNATLYYPTYSGKGILAETRTLSFAGRDKGEMIKTLLSALSQGAQTLGNTPAMPELSVYLTEAPAVQEETVVEESTVKKPVSEEEAPVEEKDAETPEQPAVPSGSNSIKELFKFHCTADDTHADQTYNWFGSYVKYNNDIAYDAARGVWTASANITNVQTLLSTGVKAPNKVWGKTLPHRCRRQYCPHRDHQAGLGCKCYWPECFRHRNHWPVAA